MKKIDEIERLGALLSEGKITNQEFEMLKQNILTDSTEVKKVKSDTKKDDNKEKIENPQKVADFKKITLKKVTCLNCGAELLFDPNTQLTNCNFCGSHFEIKNSIDEEVITPDGIVPFSVSKERYEVETLAWLSQGDYTPVDILESSVFSEINGLYIPAWYYPGKYHGNWSASSGYDYQQEYTVQENGKSVTRTRIVTDWRPSSGNCDGELKALGFASDDYKSELVFFSYLADIRKSHIKPYDSRYTLGFNLMEFNKMTQEESWDRFGSTGANADIEAQIRSRIPGDHYKDFHVEASFDKEPPIRIYIPAWITYYNYDDQKYYVFMDGKNSNRVDGIRPLDSRIKANAERFSNPTKIVLTYTFILLIEFFGISAICDGLGVKINSDSIFITIHVFLFIGIFALAIILPFAEVYVKKIVISNAQHRRDKILIRVKNLKE